MGAYVRELIERGLRGRELASAIHEEIQRRRAEHGRFAGRRDGDDHGFADDSSDPGRHARRPNGDAPGAPRTAPPASGGSRDVKRVRRPAEPLEDGEKVGHGKGPHGARPKKARGH